MASFLDSTLTKTRVLDATLVTDVGVTTALVDCFGAKQVVFIVRGKADEDSDTFIAPTLTGKVASDSDAITPVALSATATNQLGLLCGTIPAATSIGSQGYICSLFPEGVGTEAGSAGSGVRIGANSVGLFIDVSTGLTITDVVVDAIVIWN